MLNYGYITEVDYSKGFAKVDLVGKNIPTGWIQMLVQSSKETKHIFPYAIGEYVAVLMVDNSDNGVILGAVYGGDDKPDGGSENVYRIKFKDGATIEYDTDASTLKIDAVSALDIAAEDVTITVSGTCTIDGNLYVTGDINVDGSIDALDDISTTGNVDAFSDVSAGAGLIKLTTHKHSGVTTGPGSTGPSIP